MNATSRRSPRFLCNEYGNIKYTKLYAIWRRNHGERSMCRRDDEKLQCRDGVVFSNQQRQLQPPQEDDADRDEMDGSTVLASKIPM